MILSRICRDSTWLSVEHALINHRVMNDALASLAAEFKPLSGRVALYAKGKVRKPVSEDITDTQDLITPAENIDMAHIQALLEAVSSAVTVSADERERLSTDPANCVKDVLGGMVVMSLLALDDEGSLQTQGMSRPRPLYS
jgi:hypothetical protein